MLIYKWPCSISLKLGVYKNCGWHSRTVMPGWGVEEI